MRLWRATKHENRVQRASHVETGQSVIQASVVGDCLKVGSLCDDTDPADKTDPRRFLQGIATEANRGVFMEDLASVLSIPLSILLWFAAAGWLEQVMRDNCFLPTASFFQLPGRAGHAATIVFANRCSEF